MGELKKSGKALLRAVDNRKASGVCQYSLDFKRLEATVAAQIFDSAAAADVVLQYGADREYLCCPPAKLNVPIRADAGVAAVWVTEGGKPVLFAQIAPGAFDISAARARLTQEKQLPHTEQPKPPAQTCAAASQPAAPASPPNVIKATFRESREPDAGEPFPSAGSVLLLQPGAQPAAESAAAESPQPAQPSEKQTTKPPEAYAEPVMKIASVSTEASAAEKATLPAPPPLVVRRAPRPTPRQPIYSPLWDDVSAEFEKMLGNLPRTQPFNGAAEDAQFAEMPLAGAVQCYVGSVEIKGMKVFLQAVPARPFARPAGFDHSLVSRDGETFWVKYFIQD